MAYAVDVLCTFPLMESMSAIREIMNADPFIWELVSPETRQVLIIALGYTDPNPDRD